MPEVYGIAVNIVADTLPLTRAIQKMSADLLKFDELIRATTKNIEGLIAPTAAVGAELRKAFGGTALSELRQFSNATATLARREEAVAAAARQAAVAMKEAREAQAALPPLPSRMPGGGGHTGRFTREELHRANHAIGTTGAVIGGTYAYGFHEAADFHQILAPLVSNNEIGLKGEREAEAKALDLARNTPGLTPEAAAHIIKGAYDVLGSLKETFEIAPDLAKDVYNLSLLPGEHHGDIAYQMERALELMQLATGKDGKIDPAVAAKYAHEIAQVDFATGGRVGPDQYAAFAQTGRGAVIGANDEFRFRDAPAGIIAMGGSKFGTAIKAVNDQFVHGKMTEENMNALKKLGLIDKDAKWSGGRVVDAGHKIHGAKLANDNPAEWVEKVLMPALAAHGIDTNDKAAVAKAISSFSQRRTGEAGLTELALAMAIIEKERAKINATTGDPAQVMRDANPAQQNLNEVTAAWHLFLISLGDAAAGPAIAILKDLTGALNTLGRWAKEHPKLAEYIGETGLALFGLSVAIKGLEGAAAVAKAAMLTIRAAAGLAAAGEGVAAGVGAGGAGLALGVPVAIGAGAVAGAGYSVNAIGQGIYGWMPDSHENWPSYSDSLAPKASQGPGGGSVPVTVHTDVHIDGRKVGEAVSNHMGDRASRPSRGPTSYDPSMTPAYPSNVAP